MCVGVGLEAQDGARTRTSQKKARRLFGGSAGPDVITRFVALRLWEGLLRKTPGTAKKTTTLTNMVRLKLSPGLLQRPMIYFSHKFFIAISTFSAGMASS